MYDNLLLLAACTVFPISLSPSFRSDRYPQVNGSTLEHTVTKHQQSATAILFSTRTRPLHINLADIRQFGIATYVVKLVDRVVDIQAVLDVPHVVGFARTPHGGVEREMGSVSPDKVALLHQVSASHPQFWLWGPDDTFEWHATTM